MADEPFAPEAARAAAVPRPRNPDLPFDATIPRHWLGGSPLATQLANGVNLLFPDGERFFVRSVRHFHERLSSDPVLWEQVRGFFGQEGRHAGAHERYFEVLEQQGYRIRPFLRVYRKLAYDWLEGATSPELHLAGTVALEHFTALLAEDALEHRFLDRAHPQMRALLLWHAAEEIEHKAVAFDALRAINPSYRLRMAGLALAVVTLGGFWAAASLMLLAQDGQLGLGLLEQRRRIRAIRKQSPLGSRVFLRGIREYMRPDFHPSQMPNDHLARQYLAEAGLAS